MGFTETEKESIKIARDTIFLRLETNCPNLHNEWKKEAAMGIVLPENRTGNYSKDEKFEIIAKGKIKETVRNSLEFVKSVMGDALKDYSKEEIGGLLEILFYFDNENDESLYRRGSDTEESGLKSINAQIKKGKFLYKYEEVYESFIKITKKYMKNRIVEHNEVDEESMCADFYQNYLQIAQAEIRESCKAQQYWYVHLFWIKWNDYIDRAISEMRRIEKENAELVYPYEYFVVIFESMREVLYYLYEASYIEEERKWDMSLLFDMVLDGIEDYCSTESQAYDLIQNYGIHWELYSFEKERDIFINIIDILYKELKSGEYRNYNEEYDVRGLDLHSLPIQKIKEKFCEEGDERLDRFQKKYKDCELIFQWFAGHHQRNFPGEESVVLKSIYRECFIYNNVPKEISRRGIKSFLNSIKNGELGEARNMSEMEMFVWEKIRRGIYREQNRMEQFVLRLEFMEEFHKFEKAVVRQENRRGHYLSEWIRHLQFFIQIFVESGL